VCTLPREIIYSV